MNTFDILFTNTIRDRETARFHLIAAAAAAAAAAIADADESNLDAIIDAAKDAVTALVESRLTAAERHLARLVEVAFGDCRPQP